MTLLNRYRAWRDQRAIAKAVREDARRIALDAARELTAQMAGKTEAVKGMRIARDAVAAARTVVGKVTAGQDLVKPYTPPKGVLPAEMAMDYDCTDYAFVNGLGMGSWGAGYFKGYQYYAMLAQQPEYRKISETIAEEMTRKWIKIRSTGDEDKSEAIQKLDAAMKKFKVRDHFRTMATYDGFYGRGQLYIDVKTPKGTVASTDPVELQTILVRASAKIPRGSLVGFKSVEPVWTYPGRYNSDNPLAPTFYRPTSWYVMGREIHATRIITFISRPVPDLLKASYNFGGLSMSQLAEPYVDNWLRTRDSVSDLVHSFSLSGIATDLGTILSGGGAEQMGLRAQMFTETRDNRGLMLIDKGTEEYFQHDTPLSGLDKLQAQAQEQQSAVASIPLVKLLGITPSGLNASSDGEIRVFYDHIHASQEADWRDALTAVIEIIQLSEFGAIDPDITFDFEPLWEADDAQMAAQRKTDADTDAVLITAGVITPDESRNRLIDDPTTPYHSLERNPDAKDISEQLSDEEAARSAELLAKTTQPDANEENDDGK